jgi:hypothetical protein
VSRQWKELALWPHSDLVCHSPSDWNRISPTRLIVDDTKIPFQKPKHQVIKQKHSKSIVWMFNCWTKFSWSTLCCIHSSNYMLQHLGKPIQIWCWCILPTQYELILSIVRSKVFNGKGWPSWSLTSKFLILWNNTTHL